MSDIWDLIEDDPAVAEDMKGRSELLINIREVAFVNEWSYSEAASVMGIDAFTTKNILNGHIDKFNQGFLRDMLDRIARKGYDV